MTKIATLGSSVRLVVFQFLMKSAQVPAIIPMKRTPDNGNGSLSPLPSILGAEVLHSTPQLDIHPLASRIAFLGDYEMVDVWEKPHDKKWDMSFVRFVFCHKEHVRPDELFHDFVAKKHEFERVFADLVTRNVWAVQGHLNPYFEKDGRPSGQRVLMFGCAGRVPNDQVFSGGRDENNRGVGPKVLLSTLSQRLTLVDDNVVLMAPEPVQEMAPTTA